LLFFNVSNSMTSEATQALWRHTSISEWCFINEVNN
jgi:hypothetical protein